MKKSKNFIHFVFILTLALLVPLSGLSQNRQSLEDRILEKLDLKEGMIVADIGAGNGGFSVKMARVVGPKGHVYATEIKDYKIQRIKSRIEDQGIENITPVLGEEEDAVLPEKVDFMVLKYVYHHLSSPDNFMTSLLKYLNPGGQVAVIAVDINSVGSSRANREDRDACISDPVETSKTIEQCGFKFVKREEVKTSREVEYILFLEATNQTSNISEDLYFYFIQLLL